MTRIDWAAYMLATTMHETAYTFHPIHEYGGKSYFINRYGGQTRKGRELGNDTPEEGYDYAGKGDVQLTGEANYEKSESALRREYPALVADFERRTGKVFDLTVGDQPNDKNDPKNAQDPKIAYAIMSYGMRSGLFTGHKLSQHLNAQKKDYINARRIINGTDKANTIARYAEKFESILKASLVNNFEDLKNGDFLDSAATFSPNRNETSPPPIEFTEAKPTPETPAPTQTAENITNVDQSNKTVPDNFVPENKTIEAPPPSNMLQRAKLWILGLGVLPTTGAGIVEAGRNLFSDGTLNLASVFEVVKQVLIFLMPYLFWVVLAFIAFWGIKELLKQISFIVNQYTLARGDMNNIRVVANVEAPKPYSWMSAVLPKIQQPVSVVKEET